ncbi:putative acyl-activating enzyme 18, peroxisomal [Tetrabaena socialis]|uniref:Putative acyl-activating enzyme 18, peroxisomal n=1 Tax=Tetrabaena socialis TaxID=47790 RepID=A0A2J8AG05_9CHLO|nr:putative acyl-activating enzyme 18, peroxisomal [Tetrabaena socialis]|eukprot:PNH11422.1 putative acyl-activating enzyme 18, peroxisomal [Tetrabaena socialis]
MGEVQVYYAGMPLYGGTGLPLRRHGDELAAMPPLSLGSAGAGSSSGGVGAVSYCALGRCDDTMNLGGIKVSSVELERAVVEGVMGVVEAAAVGVAPPAGGPEELHLFLVLAPGAAQQPGPHQADGPNQAAAQGGGGGGAVARQRLAALHQECTAAVRAKLNPLFKARRAHARPRFPALGPQVSRVAVVPSLPRNASNKVMRRLLRDEVPGRARL